MVILNILFQISVPDTMVTIITENRLITKRVDLMSNAVKQHQKYGN